MQVNVALLGKTKFAHSNPHLAVLCRILIRMMQEGGAFLKEVRRWIFTGHTGKVGTIQEAT